MGRTSFKVISYSSMKLRFFVTENAERERVKVQRTIC